jgi:FixJ family two-component response regulator
MTARRTVYVIDDDQSVRRAIGRLLNVAGYAVVLLESVAAFLALGTVEDAACLLVDVRMPGMTGLDLQDALNASGRRLPIVFMTGQGDADMAARVMAAGAFAFLAKPVDGDELCDVIHRASRRDRSDR